MFTPDPLPLEPKHLYRESLVALNHPPLIFYNTIKGLHVWGTHNSHSHHPYLLNLTCMN